MIVALNRFGSDTDREFELIKKHLGEQGVEALVCEHFAKGSKGALPLAKSMVKLIDEKPGSSATTPTSSGRRSASREEDLSRERGRCRHRRAQEDREVPTGRLRQSADLNREDAVLILDRSAASGSRSSSARAAAGG